MPFIVHKTLSNRYSSACQSIAVSNGPWRRHHTSLGRRNHFPMKPHPLSRTFHHLHKPVAHRNLLGTSPCLHDRVLHRPWSRGLTIHKLFYIHFDWQSGHLPALTLWPNYHPRRVYHILKGTTWKKIMQGLHIIEPPLRRVNPNLQEWIKGKPKITKRICVKNDK
mgnify:CR=1 FL=1